jgi:hypothetical protein
MYLVELHAVLFCIQYPILRGAHDEEKKIDDNQELDQFLNG